MLKTTLLKKTFFGLAFAVAITVNGVAQMINKPVYKTFIQEDSSAINNSAVMVFYSDKSFINYGILKDLQNQEVYVWYTFGKWTEKNNEIICKSYFEEFNQKKVIDEIKHHYKRRNDYRLIESYYEFVNERYQDVHFLLIKNKAIDENKKIEYLELTTDTLNN